MKPLLRLLTLFTTAILISLSGCKKTDITERNDNDLEYFEIAKKFNFVLNPNSINQLRDRYGSAKNWEQKIIILKARKEKRKDEIQIITDSDPGGGGTSHRVLVLEHGSYVTEFYISEETPLKDALEAYGVFVNPCDCVGVGGSCAAKLIYGNIEQFDQSFLCDNQIAQGFLLPCVTYAVTDICVNLNQEANLPNNCSGGNGQTGQCGNQPCSGGGGSGGGIYPQWLIDEMLMAQIVKDSTNDPCNSLVISKIKSLDSSMPRLFRNIFGENAEINITVKTTNQGPSQGAETITNYLTNNFIINMNSYFTDATTLSKAASLLHEAIHANLMYLYQNAVVDNNAVAVQQIETDFILFLDSTKVANNPNLSYTELMNQNSIGQHQIMTFQHVRDAMASTLFSFAQKLDPNTPVDLNYCKKLAWTGTNDSKGYKNLSSYDQDDIQDVISGERGNNLNQSSYSQLGKTCP